MLPAESELSAGRDSIVRPAISTPINRNTCLASEDRSGTSDDRRAITSTTAALIPSIAALAGSRFVNPSLVDGLLQAVSEARGLDPTRQALGELERELLDVAFPHRVELIKGPWLDALPGFVGRDLQGLCALYLHPLAEGDADVVPMVFRYLVCFTDQTDAALFRLNFG